MPGTKWKRSLKRPKVYEVLRAQGKSKSSAAAISNASAKKHPASPGSGKATNKGGKKR